MAAAAAIDDGGWKKVTKSQRKSATQKLREKRREDSRFTNSCQDDNGNANVKERTERMKYKACENKLRADFGKCRGEEKMVTNWHTRVKERKCVADNGAHLGWSWCNRDNPKIPDESSRFRAAAQFGECIALRDNYDNVCLKPGRRDPDHGKYYLRNRGTTCSQQVRDRTRMRMTTPALERNMSFLGRGTKKRTLKHRKRRCKTRMRCKTRRCKARKRNARRKTQRLS